MGRGRRGLERLTFLSGLMACSPAPGTSATSSPQLWTPPRTSGGDSLGEQMPTLVGAGGLRKQLFLLGAQPGCMMGEGPAASVVGPDSGL